jgi:type II secretory pathway predicted ATPase ExeA
LSLPATSSTGQAWRQIADRICELQLESLHAVLLLDDLDRAGSAALALVERLLSLQAAPLTIVASARPETAARLGERILEHAALRIDLVPWNEAETSDYLAHRPISGKKQVGIEASAARRMFELSGGAPRRVNQLALLAEVASVGQGLTTIDEDTVNAVYEELAAAR